MEIIFCDTCGIRIPNNEVMRSLSPDGSIVCEKCRHAAVPLPKLPPDENIARRPSTSTSTLPPVQRVTPKPVQVQLQASPRAASDRPAAGSRETPGNGAGTLIGVGIAFGCVSLLGLFFMFSSDKPVKSAQDRRAAEPAPEMKVAETHVPRENVATPMPNPAHAEPRNDNTRALPTEKPDLSHSSFAPLPPQASGRPDPEEAAQKKYDQVQTAIAKEDAPGKIKKLEDFVNECDANTFAASRARAQLSSLKKAADIPKPSPAPKPVAAVPLQKSGPETAAAAKSASNSSAIPNDKSFKEDFETTGYGVNFGTVVGDLPAGRPGKALKLGGERDKRGGIYNYAYPQTSNFFKTGILAVHSEGMRVRLKYFLDGMILDVVVGWHEPGNETMHYSRVKMRVPQNNSWTDFDVPIADLKEDDGAVAVPIGALVTRIEIWVYGSGGPCYIDDIEFAEK